MSSAIKASKQAPEKQQLVLLSGLSGSGKTIALHALEDLNYYCVDNLPSGLLQAFILQILEQPERYPAVAVAIDARDRSEDLGNIPRWLSKLADKGIDSHLLFLTASRKILLQRFSETRRRHPLTSAIITLPTALDLEQEILAPLKCAADHVINTSDINLHQLRRQIARLITQHKQSETMTLVLQSFAFKQGIPEDLDFLFDVRCLPNPHWETQLRSQCGRNQAVIDWLGSDEMTLEYLADTFAFLNRWLEKFVESQRSYITIGIGCTGGQHRSVYLAERLAEQLRGKFKKLQLVHRELE
ncbi:MAG: RNase adapter RapZ [Xanthomonadales bacterium]|nr:RNase adapter RapZ [Xanthomonadales bacterium]